MRRCRTAGWRCSRTQVASSLAAAKVAAASSPSARSTASSGRPKSDCSTQPSGVGTLIPSALSSQTKRIGRRCPPYAMNAAVLSADLRGRVVQRGVAERAHDDRVLRPGGGDAELPRASIAKAIPTARGRCEAIVDGLREDGEVGVAEDLVTAARDRLLLGGRHPEEHVPDAVVARLRRPREVEAARAVVEQRRVGRPERQRDEGVRLVAGGADRVEAELPGLEPPCRVVDRPALDPAVQARSASGGSSTSSRRRSSARSPASRCCSSGSRSSLTGPLSHRAGTRGRPGGASPPDAARRRRAGPSRRAPRRGAAAPGMRTLSPAITRAWSPITYPRPDTEVRDRRRDPVLADDARTRRAPRTPRARRRRSGSAARCPRSTARPRLVAAHESTSRARDLARTSGATAWNAAPTNRG